MEIKFKSKIINIHHSIGVIIPKPFFNGGMLQKNKEYVFVVKEVDFDEEEYI